MFHNNNQAIIRKTAKKSFAANKGRNAFIMFAVFLTTFMLGTIISLSVSYMETQKAHKNRLMGTTAHVTLTNVTDDQIEKIKNLDYVSICSYSIEAGSVQDEGYLNGNNVILEYCESVEWEHFKKPIISNIVGNYPLKIDEIMLPVWILENMGITEPVLGMEIPLVFQIDTKQPQTQTFKLSGYFTSYTLFRPGSTESILVSQVFTDETKHSIAEYGHIQIQFVKNNPEEYIERLINDVQIDSKKINAYITSNELDPIIYVYTVIVVFLVIAAFLLIYNVMSVSVSRDIRFYGLMKTIGMTPRQIRNMVLQQIMRFCIIAIPIGLLFSALVSFVVVPWFINSTTSDFMRTGGADVSFNPFIFVGAAVFAFLTTLLGAFNPAKKAAGISPIEAVRFSKQDYSRKQIHSSKFNSMKAAWRNVFRVRKRAVLVFCSMSIGLTMFLLVMIILKSTDLDIYIESMSKNINGDISLRNRMPDYANFYDFDDYQAFTPEFIERLNSLPGFAKMKMHYVQLIKKDSGFLDMQGNIHYTLEFINVSEEGDIAEFDNDLNQFVGEPVIYEIDLYIDSAEQTQALSMINEWTNKQQYIQWRSGIETRVETENIITTLMIMGSSISVILWLIGMINFINVITTSILSRRHELALLEIIGQSPKQSKKMLTSEGIIYAVITLLLVGVFGGSLTYGLYSLLASQYDYFVFNFPYIPILVMVCIVFAICLSIPRLTYKLVTKMSLVDRLREVE